FFGSAIFEKLLGNQSGILTECSFDLAGHFRVVLEILLGVFTALPEPLGIIGEPRTRLFDNTSLHAKIDQLTGLGNASTIHDVELHLLEGRSKLVLDDLDTGLVAYDFITFLDRADTTNIETNRSIELESVTASRRFRRTEHHTDLHADLVDEDHHAVGTRDRRGKLAERLAHETCLKTRQGVTHFTFDFGARRQGSHRVDDENVDSARTHERIGDLKRLLAGIRLRNQQVFKINAQLAGIDRIERMFRIDECTDTALLLCLRDRVQRQCRLTGAFRAI